MLYIEPLVATLSRGSILNHKSIERVVMACYVDNKHPIRLFVPEELVRPGDYGWGTIHPERHGDMITYRGIPMIGLPQFDQVGLTATDIDLVD